MSAKACAIRMLSRKSISEKSVLTNDCVFIVVISLLKTYCILNSRITVHDVTALRCTLKRWWNDGKHYFLSIVLSNVGHPHSLHGGGTLIRLRNGQSHRLRDNNRRSLLTQGQLSSTAVSIFAGSYTPLHFLGSFNRMSSGDVPAEAIEEPT